VIAALLLLASLAVPERSSACSLSTTGAATVLDGAVYRLNLSAVDTGDGLPTAWTISWGDGAIETFAGNPASVTHVYRPIVPSTFTFGILASAICGGKTYFQNDLVVASSRNDSLTWYAHDATTNRAVSRPPTISGPQAGLDYPCDPIVGPDGNVYVGGWTSGNVVRYDQAGNPLGQFATGGSAACGMAFGPDGNLYVADKGLSTVRRYDGTSGAYLGDFVTANLGGLDQAEGLTFGPDGNLYVTDFKNAAGNAVFSLQVVVDLDPLDEVVGPTLAVEPLRAIAASSTGGERSEIPVVHFVAVDRDRNFHPGDAAHVGKRPFDADVCSARRRRRRLRRAGRVGPGDEARRAVDGER
jgi:hypothetical protein